MTHGSASAEQSPTRSSRPSRWLEERWRSSLALAIAILAAVAILLVNTNDRLFTGWNAGVVVLLAYLFAYLVVTVGAFARATPAAIREWAERDSRGSFMQRYILGTAPGPGVSITISIAALAVAVVWMPGHGGREWPATARIIVALVLVAVAWLCVMISFAVAFHADNLVEDEAALDFPGKRGHWADYVYFAMSVMTTFGTTDVSVTSPAMRRTVTANALIAFIFNTITVAAVVSALTG